MEEEKSKQHTQLPNKMAENELTPKDQLVYLGIRSFMNSKTNSCFPSLQKIADKVGASIPTIRKSISLLEDKGYIKTTKKGRGQEYHFNELKKFEPFSPDFLNHNDLSFTAKSYLVASQQYMYKDVEGYGKISYSNADLSKQINMPETTIRRCNQELERNNYLTIIKNECRDLESGCKSDTKIFDLNKLGQAIIWVLKTHEDRLNDHEDKLENINERLSRLEADKEKDNNEKKEMQKMIDMLMRENKELKTKNNNETYIL